MNTDVMKKFVLDPQWPTMQEMIESFFEHVTNINDIDTSHDSSVVHAEVIATQKITKALDDMRTAFDQVRNVKSEKAPTCR